MNIYVFVRAEGFYPLELKNDASAKSNAAINPGTLKVIRMYPLPETTIWDATESSGSSGAAGVRSLDGESSRSIAEGVSTHGDAPKCGASRSRLLGGNESRISASRPNGEQE